MLHFLDKEKELPGQKASGQPNELSVAPETISDHEDDHGVHVRYLIDDSDDSIEDPNTPWSDHSDDERELVKRTLFGVTPDSVKNVESSKSNCEPLNTLGPEIKMTLEVEEKSNPKIKPETKTKRKLSKKKTQGDKAVQKKLKTNQQSKKVIVKQKGSRVHHTKDANPANPITVDPTNDQKKKTRSRTPLAPLWMRDQNFHWN